MALRVEKTVGALLMAGFGLWAQSAEVRHKHLLRGGCTGELRVTAGGVEFEATGPKAEHRFRWAWQDIQELELSPARATVLTYEDNRWNSARDREVQFDRLPRGFAESVRGRLRSGLPGKFIDATGEALEPARWQIPAKLTGSRWQGVQGVLEFSRQGLHFEAAKNGESRTWPFSEIESVATAGPHDLSVVTREKHGWTRAAGREFRFQLRQPLDKARYQELWEAVEGDKGLESLKFYKGEKE